MKAVIKKIFIFLLLFTAFNAWAEEKKPQVDLSVTITSLAQAAKTGNGTPEAGARVILNGTVIERSVVNPDTETFSAELLMASGEWEDSDTVLISKCIIVLNGREYSKMVPARRSRNENPDEITLNSELLVYGTFLGFAETDEGVTAVVQADGVRKL